MIVSTRGRYALRVIVDLAENGKNIFVPLKDIAERQMISQRYAESIMTLLSKNNFVDGVHGKGGGYKLNKDPSEYKIGDILRLTEGSLSPVACLEKGAPECERKTFCRTIGMWQKLDTMINDFFDGITISDLMKK